MTIAIASALAFCVGFALQRGSLCAVLAVRDVIEEKRWARFNAFLECAAWALLGLIVADALGVKPIDAWVWQESVLAAIAGGAIFGVGALVNGACAFGSISRLASGETSFLALITGLVAGGLLAGQFGASGAIAAHMPFAISGWLLVVFAAALTAFALWRIVGAWRATPGVEQTMAKIAAPRWPPALAMFAIALANVGLLLLVVDWPYTTFLVDLASGRSANNETRALLALTLLAGGFAGAATAGRFRLRGASAKELFTRACGGALMGFGATMIPGGNDALVLMGLPLLQPTAVAAYLAMIATIALGFSLRRRMRADAH